MAASFSTSAVRRRPGGSEWDGVPRRCHPERLSLKPPIAPKAGLGSAGRGAASKGQRQMRGQEEVVVKRAEGEGSGQSRRLANSCRKQRPGSLPPPPQTWGHGGTGTDPVGLPGRTSPAAGSAWLDDSSAPTFLTRLASPQGKRALKTFFFPHQWQNSG